MFFFDICDGDDVASDPEGQELADLDAARREAALSARELLCGDVTKGIFTDARTVRVRDAGGITIWEASIVEAAR